MSDVKKVHVDGKVYDIKDSKSVATLGATWPDIATLNEFVNLTASTPEQVNRGYSFIFRDTGGWGPRKTKNDWYRCLIVRYQNRIGTQWDVDGTALLTTGYGVYLGYITGTTTFTVKWYTLVEEGSTIMREAVPITVSLLNGHFVGGSSGWTAMTSHDLNNINTRYRFQLGGDGVVYKFKTTDGGGSWQQIGTFQTQQANNYFASVYYADPSPTDVTVSGVLKFNTIVNNFGGCYSTSTGIYTCPVAGLYYANFTFYSNNASASQRAQVSMGGRGYVVNGSHGHSISAMEFLPAGAQIFAGCPNSNYPFTFYSGANHNRFTVNLVKATT